MPGFLNSEVLLQVGYDVIVISPLGGAFSELTWRILKKRPRLPDILIVFHSNFYVGCVVSEKARFYCKSNFPMTFYKNLLSWIHGFRNNEVLLQARYDVIVSFSLVGASGEFHDGIWKSDHDFLIVFHSNLLSVMQGFPSTLLFSPPLPYPGLLFTTVSYPSSSSQPYLTQISPILPYPTYLQNIYPSVEYPIYLTVS